MRGWQVSELGDPWDVLRLVDLEAPAPSPGTALIEVDATDLNFADILQCQGTYQVKLDPPFVSGMGAAGRVVAVGEGADLAVGQRIVGSTAGGWGGYATHALIAASSAQIVPDDIDPTVAMGMHITYGTAWFALHQRGNIAPGESVLVLAAAGGVGSAAVQMAKAHGCEVIAAAGGPDKVEVCRALGADSVIDYNAEDLYERVMALTDGRGVDVVYDPVGGSYFDIARRLVAWEGRLLVVGFASGTIPSAPANHVLVKNYSVVGVHMGGYRGRFEEPFARCYDELYDSLRAGQIEPLVSEVLSLEELPRGLRGLADRVTTGRVVMVPR